MVVVVDDILIGADLLIIEGDKFKVDGLVFINEKLFVKLENGVNVKFCFLLSDFGSFRDGFCR